MSKTKKLLVVASVAFSAATVQADFVGVQDPLGWDRGDTNSGFVDFDFYSAAPSTGNSSVANGGGLTGSIDVDAGYVISGTATDNRIYDLGGAISWDISASSSLFDVNFIELQVKENAGTGLSNVSAFVNGEAADSFSAFDDGNGHFITRFLWDLDSTILAGTSFNLSLDSAGAHQSYDSFSLDTSAVSTVPVPAAAWLFGSALMGLGVIRRKS